MYSRIYVNFSMSLGPSFNFSSICWNLLKIACDSDFAFLAIISIKFFCKVWYFSERNYFISLQEISNTDTLIFYGNFYLINLSFLMIYDISAWICSTYHELSSIYIFLVNSSGSILRSYRYYPQLLRYSCNGRIAPCIIFSTSRIKNHIHLFSSGSFLGIRVGSGSIGSWVGRTGVLMKA